MNIFEHPWQVTPSLLIEHAMEHTKKDSDFDKQMAYLLVDVGVETIFKVFLANNAYKEYKNLRAEAKKNLNEVKFHQLLVSVKQFAGKKLQGIEIDESDYFHEKRNQIYHQGDGVAPTKENLDRYLDLAQKLIKVLIDVDITKLETRPESKYIVWDEGWKGNRTFEEVVPELFERLKYFHDSCAVLTELIQPKYATRKFALEIQEIMEDNQTMVSEESEIDDAKEIIDKASERLRLLNQLVQKPIEDLEFADYLLKDINHLYVLKSFQGLGDNRNENWGKYVDVHETIQGLPSNWIREIDYEHDSTTISKGYKEIVTWLIDIQGKIDKKINEIDPDIYRPGVNIIPFEL